MQEDERLATNTNVRSSRNWNLYSWYRGLSRPPPMDVRHQPTKLSVYFTRYESRLKVWLGDLSMQRLGLCQNSLKAMVGKGPDRSEKIDVFVHNGAKVHYGMSYADLEAENVLSTVELLKFMLQNPGIHRFVYVSGGQINPHSRVTETSCFDSIETSGYTKSKLVSEALIYQSSSDPLFESRDFHIVKPGFIAGNDRSISTRTQDFLWRLVAACVNIGAYNGDEADCFLYLAGVDSVSDTIVQEALGESRDLVRTVSDGLTLSTFWGIVRDEMGVELEPLRKEEWLEKLQVDLKARGKAHELYPLSYLVSSGHLEIGVRSSGNDRATNVLKSCIRTLYEQRASTTA